MSLRSTARRWLARLRDDRRGGILAYLAVVLPVLIGLGALAVDGASAYATRNLLQATADSAALAAASALPDDASALSRAQAVALENMPVARYGTVLQTADVATGNWNETTRTFTAGATPKNAVRTLTRRTAANGNALDLTFARMFGVDAFDVSAQAVATNTRAICLIVLHPSAGDAMHLDANARLEAPNCLVQVNSSHGKALSTDGNTSIEAGETCVHGGVEQKGTITPAATTGCDVLADPYAGLAAPTAGGGCVYASKVVVSVAQLLPGDCVYNGGIEIKSGVVTFGPGVHIFRGDFDIKAGAVATGAGVTLYMDSPSHKFELGSNASLALSAPTTGPLAGVLLFTARGNKAKHTIVSNTTTRLDGLMYFPDAELLMRSNSTVSPLAAGCAQIVANTFEMDSHAEYRMSPNYANCGRGTSDKMRLVR